MKVGYLRPFRLPARWTQDWVLGIHGGKDRTDKGPGGVQCFVASFPCTGVVIERLTYPRSCVH